MDIINQIEDLVREMCIRGHKVGPFVHLCPEYYSEIKSHLIYNSANPYTNIGSGHVTLQIMTSEGDLVVLRNPHAKTGYIGINGITLLDIIAERELLGL